MNAPVVRRPDDRLPLASLPGWRRRARYLLVRLFVRLAVRILFRIDVEGAANVARGPALYCFNHMSWVDPFVFMTVVPLRPTLYFFGPKEEDMAVGARNRLMIWSGEAVPFRPEKDDLLETTRRVQAVFESGGVLAIAGEGRIHVHEGDLLPLQEGAAYFAIRSHVPIVPVGINGTSWLWWRARLQVRFGEPIATEGRATRDAIDAYTTRTWLALHALVRDSAERPRPRGRFGRRLSDLFNDWGPGGREGADPVRGPTSEEVRTAAAARAAARTGSGSGRSPGERSAAAGEGSAP